MTSDPLEASCSNASDREEGHFCARGGFWINDIQELTFQGVIDSNAVPERGEPVTILVSSLPSGSKEP